jgi:hypothetical protein
MLTWQYFLARSNLPLLRYICHTSLEEKQKTTEKLREIELKTTFFVTLIKGLQTSTCTFSMTFGNCKDSSLFSLAGQRNKKRAVSCFPWQVKETKEGQLLVFLGRSEEQNKDSSLFSSAGQKKRGRRDMQLWSLPCSPRGE